MARTTSSNPGVCIFGCACVNLTVAVAAFIGHSPHLEFSAHRQSWRHSENNGHQSFQQQRSSSAATERGERDVRICSEVCQTLINTNSYGQTNRKSLLLESTCKRTAVCTWHLEGPNIQDVILVTVDLQTTGGGTYDMMTCPNLLQQPTDLMVNKAHAITFVCVPQLIIKMFFGLLGNSLNNQQSTMHCKDNFRFSSFQK